MNKKIFLLLSILFFTGVGIAGFVLNQTITQHEFNQIDFDNLDLNTSIQNTWVENDRLFIEFQYNSFEQVVDSNGVELDEYKYVVKSAVVPYYLGYFRDCRLYNDVDFCNNEVINFVYLKAEDLREKERALLKEMTIEEILDEINITNFKDLYVNYDLYKVGRFYLVGDVFVFENELYEVIQAHTSQEDWLPSDVNALYKVHVLQEFGEVREWTQPTGAHDAYNIGDRVLFNGQVYESLINANVWSPQVYPAGWRLV